MWYIVKYPSDLCGTEICIDDQTCLASDGIGQTFLLEGIAIFGCPPVLPYDGVVDGLSCLCVPDNGGFPLVCDTYSCNVKAVYID